MMDGNSLTTVNLTREFATLWILQGNRTGLCGVSNIVSNESASKFFLLAPQNTFLIVAALGASFFNIPQSIITKG